MLDFMINKRPVGEYFRAFNNSRKSLRAGNPEEMSFKSGAFYRPEDKAFYLESLGQQLKITYPEGLVTFQESGQEPDWEWQLVALNYLSRANGVALTGQLKNYRDLEGGNSFFAAFKRLIIDRISEQLGSLQPKTVAEYCGILGAKVESAGKIKAIFPFLPRFPVTLFLWPGDEELPASANILFDHTANDYLHTEDIAVAGGLIADFLSALALDK